LLFSHIFHFSLCASGGLEQCFFLLSSFFCCDWEFPPPFFTRMHPGQSWPDPGPGCTLRACCHPSRWPQNCFPGACVKTLRWWLHIHCTLIPAWHLRTLRWRKCGLEDSGTNDPATKQKPPTIHQNTIQPSKGLKKKGKKKKKKPPTCEMFMALLISILSSSEIPRVEFPRMWSR